MCCLGQRCEVASGRTMSWCFVFAAPLLLHHSPSTASIYFEEQTNRFFSLFAVLWFLGESRLLMCGHKWWGRFPSTERIVLHFGAESQLFPRSHWQQVPCRSQLCPRDIISVQLVESPKGVNAVVPSTSRGTIRNGHRLFLSQCKFQIV